MNNNKCFTCAYYMREGICKGECGQKLDWSEVEYED